MANPHEGEQERNVGGHIRQSYDTVAREYADAIYGELAGKPLSNCSIALRIAFAAAGFVIWAAARHKLRAIFAIGELMRSASIFPPACWRKLAA